MRVQDKVALVTGAMSGIGEKCARRLAEEGAAVLLAGRRNEVGEVIAAEIRAAGGRAEYHYLDVTDESQWIAAVRVAEDAFGRLDVLINNAGIGRHAPLTETTLEHWRELMSTNAEGMFLGMKHAIPAMRRVGGGSIVNISSTAAVMALPGMTAYCASKAAVVQMTKAAAVEHAAEKIRINTVLPGFIRTPAYDNFPDVDIDQAAKATVPMGHVGETKEVADAVVFLASDEATYITGAELVIDGAQSLLCSPS